MAKQLQKLYQYWKRESRDSPQVMQSWKNMEKMKQAFIPEEKQEEYDTLLVDHSDALELQGFVAGFRFATMLWKEGTKKQI